MPNKQIFIFNEVIKNMDSLNYFLNSINISVDAKKIKIVNNIIDEKINEDVISNLIYQAGNMGFLKDDSKNSIFKSIIIDYINTILNRLNINGESYETI